MSKDTKEMKHNNREAHVDPSTSPAKDDIGKMAYSRPIVLGSAPSPKHCPIAWDW